MRASLKVEGALLFHFGLAGRSAQIQKCGPHQDGVTIGYGESRAVLSRPPQSTFWAMVIQRPPHQNASTGILARPNFGKLAISVKFQQRYEKRHRNCVGTDSVRAEIGSSRVVATGDKLLAGAISQQALRTIEALLQVVANGSVMSW
jgi:hypothetical protein